MISLSGILGFLLVIAALAIGVHEVWVYNHPQVQGLPVSRARLRRRLLGVALILALVGVLAWAGHLPQSEYAWKLALYGAAMIAVILLIGLAMFDLRDTSRQILREQLDMDPSTVERLMADPAVQDLIRRFETGTLGHGDAVELKRHLDEHRSAPKT